jgi:hypothetical protein
LIFEIFDLMISDWVSFLAYPNLFEIKDFVVVIINMSNNIVAVRLKHNAFIHDLEISMLARPVQFYQKSPALSYSEQIIVLFHYICVVNALCTLGIRLNS